MGVKDLLAAFNAETGVAGTAWMATLRYDRAKGAEWQIIEFCGTGGDGAPFMVQSDPLPPGSDVNAAARALARKFLNGG